MKESKTQRIESKSSIYSMNGAVDRRTKSLFTAGGKNTKKLSVHESAEVQRLNNLVKSLQTEQWLASTSKVLDVGFMYASPLIYRNFQKGSTMSTLPQLNFRQE